jgi:predicted nucleic acid-binding protein
MWVFDATPLIYLAKVDRLDLVQQLGGQCVIPSLVYEEVVETGLEQGYPDARRIERCVEDGVFNVVDVEETPLWSRLAENSNLSAADGAVLACAQVNDGVAVMDEAYGRDVASTEGVTTRGTAYLVLYCVSEGVISSEEARSVIDAMVEAGWYCAPPVYAKLLQKLDSLSS